mgnify:CR=1 FL=1|jgi:hypothetical protein
MEINEKTKISMEIKVMIGGITFMIIGMLSGAGVYYDLISSIDKIGNKTVENASNIEKLRINQVNHFIDYSNISKSVTTLTETTRNIEKNTDDIKKTLDYLRNKSDEKK